MNRSIINNNPLNIRRTTDRWRGMSSTQTDAQFCQFDSMEWGIRAALCLLRSYASKHHCYTIHDIIHRWAPPQENDTRLYIRFVCLHTGFGGEENLTEAQWPALIKAMARMECGIDISEELMKRAFELYKRV